MLSIRGDVDLESSPEARKVLLECVDLKKTLLVDMSGVDYIDSSGIASLVEAFQAARISGQSFALTSVSESAMRVLELARLDKVFAVYSTVEDALTDDA